LRKCLTARHERLAGTVPPAALMSIAITHERAKRSVVSTMRPWALGSNRLKLLINRDVESVAASKQAGSFTRGDAADRISSGLR